MLVIVQKDIVAVLTDIGHKYILIRKGISTLGPQSDPAKMFRYLPVVGTRISSHRPLLKDKPCFM